jgi:hypothetical protein
MEGDRPAEGAPAKQQPENDTVAQRPTDIARGAPTTPPQPDADSANRNPIPGAVPPEADSQARLHPPDRVAAGMRAVAESLKFTVRETGLGRGIGYWLKINQKAGFACQSCAWPSADEDPHVFEFCENGVKALTSEATRKTITPDFFREYSIADLQKRTDYWLELQGRLLHPMVKHRGATHYQPIEWDEVFTLMGREYRVRMLPPFTRAGAQVTRRLSCTSFSLGNLVPIICLIVRICATNRVVRP